MRCISLLILAQLFMYESILVNLGLRSACIKVDFITSIDFNSTFYMETKGTALVRYSKLRGALKVSPRLLSQFWSVLPTSVSVLHARMDDAWTMSLSYPLGMKHEKFDSRTLAWTWRCDRGPKHWSGQCWTLPPVVTTCGPLRAPEQVQEET